jgi:thioredoxin 1
MKTKLTILLFMAVAVVIGCDSDAKEKSAKKDSTAQKSSSGPKPKVTFVELGSVNCIPCKAMQPVMKALEEEFGEQLKIIFYDVWKDNAPARQYGIRVIPTQVFLDESGKEFHRHEGFYPKEEIEKLLLEKKLTKKSAASAEKKASHD